MEENIEPRPSRRDRRKSKPTAIRVPFENNSRPAWLAGPLPVIVASAIVAAGLFGGGFAAGKASAPEPVGDLFAANSETVTGDLSFAEQSYPEGWKSVQPEADAGTQTSKRNPFPAFNDSCSFSTMTTYLPVSDEGRGSEFLSKELLYAYADRAGENSVTAEPVNLKVGGLETQAVKASWKDTVVVARAFDNGVQIVPKDIKKAGPRGVETATEEGIPAVLLEYSCAESKDFNAGTAETLISQVNISPGSSDN